MLLERHGIRARLLSYHEHNEAARTAEVLPRLQAGERIALVERCGPSGRQRPWRPADRRGPRGRRAGDRAARARRRSRRRSWRAGWSASATSSSATCLAASGRCARSGRSWLRGRIAVVAFESPRRLPASLASLAEAHPDAARCGLPGAHEALRGDRAGDGGRARGALLGGAERRDHARGRAARRRSRPKTAARSRRWPSSSPRGSGDVVRRRSSRGSRAWRATASTALLCSQI